MFLSQVLLPYGYFDLFIHRGYQLTIFLFRYKK